MNKEQLIAAINAAIVENTEGNITATVLNELLRAIVTNLSNGQEVEDAITAALQSYSTTEQMSQAIATAVANKVTGTGVTGIVALTQAAYDAMAEHDPTVVYIIIPESED